jgi:endonuclease/exonuclease/phosphatase family metal-dependent hydrolase
MNRTMYIIGFASLLFAGRSGIIHSQDNQNLRLNVMTYNIRYASDQPEIYSWNNRRDGIVEIFSGVDIAGLQEVLPVQVEYLKTKLPDYRMIYRSREKDPQEGESIPLLYRQDHFAMLDSGIFWLSDTPEVAGSNTWQAACNRIVTWCRLRDIPSGKEFFVFNTHLDHVSQYAREMSIRLILDYINNMASGLPVILMGDFNVEDDNVVYRMITEYGLNDAYRGIHPVSDSTDLTFHGWRSEIGLSRIDYIFLSNEIEIRNAEVMRKKIHGIYPSDHLPVMSKIEFVDND